MAKPEKLLKELIWQNFSRFCFPNILFYVMHIPNSFAQFQNLKQSVTLRWLTFFLSRMFP